ncbi:MAG: type IX secretion system sortase PorU [Bacteroidetes bacterium]|nr:type IX secretion system sortase PorU [Bacteroidota bacterium]
MKSRFSIVVFLFLCHFLSNAQEIRVISSSNTSLVFEYNPILVDRSDSDSQNQKFVKVPVLNTYSSYDFDTETYRLPVKEVNVGVPSEFGTTISVINTEYDIIEGKLIPGEEFGKDRSENFDRNFWKSEEYISSATLGEFGLTRNLNVQSIRLHPVEYDHVKGQIKVYKKIVVAVRFGQGNDQIMRGNVDSRLKGAVLNFDVAKNWITSSARKKLGKTEDSVLASGTWYQFECPNEGIYKISRSMLSQMGIDAATVDPRTIKIYNNGGYQLPESISSERPEGLVETAIYVEGENDGSFNNDDYILFYGRGVDFWEYSSGEGKVTRNKNQFSKHNYFWITSGGSVGNRMAGKNSVSGTADVVQNTSLAYRFIDKDIINIGETGRDMFGDKFTPTSPEKTYLTKLDGRVAGSTINYSFRFANKGSSNIPLTISETGTEIYNRNLSRVYGTYTIAIEHRGVASFSGTLIEGRSNLKVRAAISGQSDEVFIDFMDIEYSKELRAIQDSLLFFSNGVNGLIKYELNNFTNSSIMVFDISDYANVSLVSNASISGGNFTFQANETSSSLSKYYGVAPTAYLAPSNFVQVSNSNLRGDLAGAEFIIITHPDFIELANEFKTYRSTSQYNSVSAKVIDVNDIYNEFSGGSLDPAAIRNFLQFAYENWNTTPFYVSLFGDGNYDYYNAQGLDENFIPTYQTIQSLHEINSFPSDDYYVRISGDDLKSDLAIGRLNIKTVDDAETILNKIRLYEQDTDRSLWKNVITLVADDGPTTQGDDGSTHTSQSERLANNIIPGYFIEDKIYLAAYPTVISGAGRRKPDVNRAIVNAVNQGTLMLNFIGHGNPEKWAHEEVFTTDASIPQLQNEKYFFLTAATCDYGKYDQVEAQSAAEIMMLMEHGSIGALTAVRPVYSSLNAALNETFYRNLFDNPSNPNYCVGDAFFLTKQTRTGDNDEKFHLFGDPTLRLNVPRYEATIDSINSQSLAQSVQIKALSQVEIKGRVLNENGSETGFNGEAIITVFDSDNVIQLPEMNYQMDVHGGIIFKGRATIESGKYEISFVVPKDISYADEKGRVLVYIYNENIDGLGFTRNVIVGGTNENIENDGAGPEIEIFYDDYEFDNAYVVNPDFNLLVTLSDETGLNTTGTGVGHRLEGILNNDDEHPIDFSNYFIGDVNTGGKAGKVEYRFTNLEAGEYNLKIKAWDVFNNQSIGESFFSVTNADGLAVENVVNYPNPFSGNTTFTFQHNLASALNVMIRVYTIAGRMVREIEEFNVFEKFVRLSWDGRDEDGNMLANGTYLYKVNVETVDGEYSKNVLGKLAIIR